MAMVEQYQKVAVHGLIKDGDRYLVTRRSQLNDWKPGEWDTPGGSVEWGELVPEEALAREISEETNLEVKISGPIHLYSSLSDSHRHQFQLIYACEYQGGEIHLNPEEHDEYRWVTLKEMGELPMIAFLADLKERTLS